MRETFRWNPYADQPHNIGTRAERVWHHFRYLGSYFSLVGANLKKLIPGLPLYRKYRRQMYQEPVCLDRPFALSLSPVDGRNEDVVTSFLETGVRQGLVRIPSWEQDQLMRYEEFIDLLLSRGVEVTVSLLQCRDDVLDLSRWKEFLDQTFSQFKDKCAFFEIGHAWNRTKWGVWNYKEYLSLARPALELGQKHGVKLVGPAVIDFEFHLYPPVLKKIPFDKISSLFYVDRVGAPENKQFGWDISAKIALLKATIDVCTPDSRDLWITEFNWPLEGTGKYSPASGKPNVTEEEQGNFLVRYCVLALASGFVERLYWWQLVAPGYGLIDSREEKWRRRPSYWALKTLVRMLDASIYKAKIPHSQAAIFTFTKDDDRFAVCWTTGPELDFTFPKTIKKILDRDGHEIPVEGQDLTLSGTPKYVFF
jgi:hypothetical protein